MESHLRAVVAALWSFDYRAISGITTPQFGPAVAAGADLRAWWPEQQLGGGGLGGVVEVTTDQHRAVGPGAGEGGGGPVPNSGGLRGPTVQCVDGVAGPLGLVGGVEPAPGKLSSLDFRWQVSTRTLVQLVVVYVTTSAPRPSWVIVVPSSATLTGDNAVGRSTTSSTSVRAPELSQPTRIAWEGSKWVESTPVQPAPTAERRVSNDSGSPTSGAPPGPVPPQ